MVALLTAAVTLPSLRSEQCPTVSFGHARQPDSDADIGLSHKCGCTSNRRRLSSTNRFFERDHEYLLDFAATTRCALWLEYQTSIAVADTQYEWHLPSIQRR